MNLFLAGGISGNISKQWKELAAKITKECESISQGRTGKPESSKILLRGGQTYELISRRGTSCEKWQDSSQQGGSIISLRVTTIAGTMLLFLP